MGEALLRGIINSSLVAPELIYASDINKEKLGILSKELNINIANNNKELIDNSDIILIAVKPDIVKGVLSEISGISHQPKWFISIAAGINTSFIESILPDGISVVRVMPNTPAMVCEGMTAICPGKYANDDHINKAKQLFQAVGKTVIVNEKLMDAVTALSGSGPAFIFLLIETLADAGVQLGLSRNDALLMSTQTVLGSSKMLLETQEHPAVLKNRVTSPGGTTAIGLFELENNGFRSAIIKAIVSSAERSKELSTQSK